MSEKKILDNDMEIHSINAKPDICNHRGEREIARERKREIEKERERKRREMRERVATIFSGSALYIYIC